MQVASKSVVLLSNVEVFDLLREVNKSSRKGKKSKQSNTATILYETMDYLKDTPSAIVPNSLFLRSILISLKPFNLTKSEKVEIVNHLPTSLVELQLMIEESEERFTEEQMNAMLNIITSFSESFNTSAEAHEEFMDTTPALEYVKTDDY